MPPIQQSFVKLHNGWFLPQCVLDVPLQSELFVELLPVNQWIP